MLIVNYPSKKELKSCVGSPLDFFETSVFGPEFKSDGDLVVCNRPHLTGHKREFFAQLTMRNGLIFKVK